MTPENQNDIWPLPKFYFSVSFESFDSEISFQEVSGLDDQSDTIEYRKNNSPQFSTVKMPGIIKSRNVTLKKGIFVNDNSFWNWFNSIKTNTIKKENVLITLLDESGSATMTWRLASAWPVQISASDMNTEGDKVAIESLELVHEGLLI